MGVASLVLGIISIVLAIFTGIFGGWIACILGIIGIILGAVARKNNIEDKMAKAGFVCSIVGTILSILFYVACIACVSTAGLFH